MRSLSKKQGFTLIEILIVVLILGIVSMTALPGIQAGLTGSRLSGAAMEIVSALEFAQTTAMTSGGRTRVTIDASDNSILTCDLTFASV